MRKFIITVIPIVLLIFFVFLMFSGYMLKKPLGQNDDIEQSINDIIEVVNNGFWEEANSKIKDLDKAWDKVITRVQFGSERDEINNFSICLARLQGAVRAKDKPSALMELYEAYNHWVELGK